MTPGSPKKTRATHAARPIDLRQQANDASGKLPPLLVAALRVAETVAQGVHGRRRPGQGEAFWQYRSYMPGDPAARIDWRRSARGPGLYVRENEWEASQTVWLWLDRSASMGFASKPGGEPKAYRASLLALALADLLARNAERFGLMDGAATTKPITGRYGVDRLSQLLASGLASTIRREQAAEGAEPGHTCESREPSLPRPDASIAGRHAETVWFGDFLDPLDDLQAMVAPFVSRRIRGHLVQVLDAAEWHLPYRGRIRFIGLEAGEGQHLVPRVEPLRRLYQEKLAAHQDGLRALVRQAGWTLTTHVMDHRPEEALLRLYAHMAHHGDGGGYEAPRPGIQDGRGASAGTAGDAGA